MFKAAVVKTGLFCFWGIFCLVGFTGMLHQLGWYRWHEQFSAPAALYYTSTSRRSARAACAFLGFGGCQRFSFSLSILGLASCRS